MSASKGDEPPGVVGASSRQITNTRITRMPDYHLVGYPTLFVCPITSRLEIITGTTESDEAILQRALQIAALRGLGIGN